MTHLTWTTAGESHGPCLIGIVEGIPAGLELDTGRIDRELARRQRGYGRGGRMKIERDRVELLSGTKAGITLGSPIAFRIENKDYTIEKLPVPTNPRPGHADLAGCQKYGHQDPRAVLERASARETAARVAAAGIARQVLEVFEIEVFAHVLEVGGESVRAEVFDEFGQGSADDRARVRDASDFFALDPEADSRMRAAVDRAREAQDSLGGIFEVRALGLPPGLGGYAAARDRLNSQLGAALLSIPAIKGVEIGLGFEAARRRGSEMHDPIVPAPTESSGASWGRFARKTNRAGGIEGGMTNGETVVVRAAMKPIPSLRQGVGTVDFETGEAKRATYQRSDVTSVPAASVVGEAEVALVLTRVLLGQLGGDSMVALRAAFENYREGLRRL